MALWSQRASDGDVTREALTNLYVDRATAEVLDALRHDGVLIPARDSRSMVHNNVAGADPFERVRAVELGPDVASPSG